MTVNLKSHARKPLSRPRPVEDPDLATQLEAILDAVWQAEKNWRLDDRIDLALGQRRPGR